MNGQFADAVLHAYDATGSAGCSGSPPLCEPIWTAPLGAGATAVSPPTVAGGVAYVTAVTPSDNMLFAFDAAGLLGCGGSPRVCSPLWTASFGTPTPYGEPASRAPAVWAGRVYVSGTSDFTVHTFDAHGQVGCSGEPRLCSELWTAAVPPFGCDASWCTISAPAVSKGRLYVTGEALDGTGGLYAFDASGGSCPGTPKVCDPLWRADAAATTQPPAIADGVVYSVGEIRIPFDEHRLRAFDAAGHEGCSGAPLVCEPLWTSTVSGLTSPPMVANGVVYASSLTGLQCEVFCSGIRHLLAFDGSGIQSCAGEPKHCAPLLDLAGPRGLQLYGDPVVANGVLYVGDLDPDGGSLRSVHALTP